MENTIKFLGLIALVAIIGLSMAACGDKDEPVLNPPTVAPANVTVGTPVFDTTTNKWNVEVSWEEVAGATGYLVGTNGTPTSSVTGTNTTVSLFALTRYDIVVAARNADGEGPASEPQRLGPGTDGTTAIPINLPATAGIIGAGQIVIHANEAAATWQSTNITGTGNGRLTNYILIGGPDSVPRTIRVEVRDNEQDSNYPLIMVRGLVRGNHVGTWLAPSSSSGNSYTFVIPEGTGYGTGNYTIILERTGQFTMGTSGNTVQTSTKTAYQLKVYWVD